MGPGSLRKKMRGMLGQRVFWYALAVAMVAGGVITKWFIDAYRVDANVDEWAGAVFWQGYGSSFTPWPHIGVDLSRRCLDRPPGNLECMPIIVPDLNSPDRLIHSFLNLKVPFTEFPLAPPVGAMITLVLAATMYKIASGRACSAYRLDCPRQ